MKDPRISKGAAPPSLPAPAAHLIAVNCHPFHDCALILRGLDPVARAARVLQQDVPGRVEARLFWHRPDPVPADIAAQISKLGLQLDIQTHHSNGENLNSQIAFAAAGAFDFFYRVDGDDIVFAQRFLLQARHLARGTHDICGGGLRYEPDHGPTYDVIPPARPGVRDYLENRFVLHPSMALRVASLTQSGLRYWTHRLEDKALIGAADAAGLRFGNLPIVLGTYGVRRTTRNGFAPKWLNLRLNLIFLRQRGAFGWMIYAGALFAGQILLGAHLMRWMRNCVYRVDLSKKVSEPSPKPREAR